MITGCNHSCAVVSPAARRNGITATTTASAAENDDHMFPVNGGERGFDAVEAYMEVNGISTTEISQDDRVASIKCIVFEAVFTPSPEGDGGHEYVQKRSLTVVVILKDGSKVDVKELDRVLNERLGGNVRVRMVSRDALVSRVGYPQGSVPPFGYPEEQEKGIVRIVDKSLIDLNDMVSFGPPERVVNIQTRDLLVGQGSIVAHVANDGQPNSNQSTRNDVLEPIPCTDGNGSLCTFAVQVVRKRKLAKRLLFATVVPASEAVPSTAYLVRGRREKKSLVWAHPVTGEPCELQCIFGKTLEKKYGKPALEMMLKKIVKGGSVCVTGARQQPASSHDSSTVVDFIVHDVNIGGTQSLMRNSVPAQPLVQERSAFQDVGWVKKKNAQRKKRTSLLPMYESSIGEFLMVQTMDDLANMVDYFEKHCGMVDVEEHEGKISAALISRKAQTLWYPEGWKPDAIVSMDAEWRPAVSRSERASPVSIVQIGTPGKVFLVDMLSLCHQEDGIATETQLALSTFFRNLFGNSNIVKIGFGLRYDMKRLSESYPWLPCFSSSLVDSTLFLSHVDILTLARISASANQNAATLNKRIGLNTLTSKILGVSLDKDEQISDWGARPLSESQIQYAIADVACLIDIYNAILLASPDILTHRTMVQCALNLFDLSDFSRPLQSDDAPPFADRFSSTSSVHNGASSKRKLNEAICNLDIMNVQYLGKYMKVGGKLGAVQACIGDDQISEFRVPRGGAVIEMSNAFLFFINIPSKVYPNTFEVTDGICRMSWWSSPGQTLQHPVIQRILDPEAKSLLLFCRRERERYVYFGELGTDSRSIEEQENGQLKIYFLVRQFQSISSSPMVSHVLSADESMPALIKNPT